VTFLYIYLSFLKFLIAITLCGFLHYWVMLMSGFWTISFGETRIWTGLHICKAGTLPLEPYLQSILLWLFRKWSCVNHLSGLTNLLTSACQVARIRSVSPSTWEQEFESRQRRVLKGLKFFCEQFFSWLLWSIIRQYQYIKCLIIVN
jgi:hypothetical protein